MNAEQIIALKELHKATARVLQKDMEQMQGFASRAESTAQKAVAKKWQIKLDALVEYYNSIDDLLSPKALQMLEDMQEQAKSLEGMQLEDRLNLAIWEKSNQERETKRYKKLFLIARQILQDQYSYDTSLLNWMKPEDVGLSLAS